MPRSAAMATTRFTVLRGDGAFGPGFERKLAEGTGTYAHAASDAALRIDESEALAGRTVFHVDRIDRADLFTLAAPPAIVPGAGDEVGMDGPGDGEPLDRQQCLATAPAAVADEVHAFTGVFAKLDEVVPLRHGEQLKALGGVHLPGVAVFDERAGRGVEGHADVHRRVADRAGVQQGNAPVYLPVKIYTLYIGASHARPRCCILWRQ